MRTAAELEELLAHGPWVRALARSLVRDSSTAEDLVQQAWLRALEHPPERNRPLRRWFAAVLRNLARQDQRADSRREARERFAGARGPESPADALATTLELSKRLADAVGQLEEPYKTAIFRRYYEGLAPRRIAELERVPLKTVKSRLARGLEKLRERLDREDGGERGSWVVACLPLLPDAHAPLLLGGIAMNVKLACAAAGLVLVGAWAVRHASRPAVPLESAPIERGAAGEPVALDTPVQATESTPEASRTSAAPQPGPDPVPAANAAAPVRELPGRVVDPTGLGVADVRLYLVPPSQAGAARRGAAHASCATSGADGRFTIQPPARGGVLLGERPGFVTLLAADVWSAGLQKELLLVVAPSIDIAGVVVDEHGQPIVGADVRIEGGDRLRRDLGSASDTAVEIPWTSHSDEQGHFAFDAVAGVASAELQAFHPRYTRGTFPMPELPRRDLRLVLASRESSVVAGEVLEPSGQPVEEALVAMGQMATRTDAHGRFELELCAPYVNGEPTRPQFLGAVKPGRLPARLEEPAAGWPGFVTLVLGGEPLAIRGKVLDAQGQPLAAIDVRATNEHRFGTVASKVGNAAWTRSYESLARGDDGFGSGVRSDSAGAFELGGLLDEVYVLLAFDRASLRMARSEPIHAGRRGVELRFALPAGVEHVAGRVLSVRGVPLAEVSVFSGRRIGGPAEAQAQLFFGTKQVTDAEGRFDFGEIVVEGLQLQLSGEDLQIVASWTPPAGARLSELELRAARRCHLQVDLGDRKELADSLVVLDEQGAELDLWLHTGNTAAFARSQPIRDGKSDVLAAPENAATVVLKKGGVEVQRRPVSLKPGALETLRF